MTKKKPWTVLVYYCSECDKDTLLDDIPQRRCKHRDDYLTPAWVEVRQVKDLPMNKYPSKKP